MEGVALIPARWAEKEMVSGMGWWSEHTRAGARRSLALSGLLVSLGVGAAVAQPSGEPAEPAESVPAVAVPELPPPGGQPLPAVLRRLQNPSAGSPFPGTDPEDVDAALVGPVLAEDPAVASTGVDVGPEPGPGGTQRDVAPAPAEPAADVVGGESDLSLAERAAALLGGTLDPGMEAPRVVVGGGAADLSQSLARALFAAPVAGSIPYVVQAQVRHDVMLVLPPQWSVVQAFVGDPTRWAVTRAGPLVVLKPGEAGARTNLTVVLAGGEVLQVDLEEITGLSGVRRVGRVYLGPERWLVDRIFSMLPVDVRERVAASPATVAQLLADPVAVVGLYGGTGAVPNPLGAIAPVAVRAPTPSGPIPGPAAGPVTPRPGWSAVPPPVFPGGPRPAGPDPRAGGPPPAFGTGGPPPVYVSGTDVDALESRLREARGRVETARRGAGDRIAAAQLALEADLEALAEEYPLRVQFSYVLDPPVPPYAEPFWHFGVWHDGDSTYCRLLAPDPVFRDADSGDLLVPEPIDEFLYRFDRVVEHGVVIVRLPDGPAQELRFRRRRELEGP